MEILVSRISPIRWSPSKRKLKNSLLTISGKSIGFMRIKNKKREKEIYSGHVEEKKIEFLLLANVKINSGVG